MEYAMILSSCNQWKESSSTETLGVFNDERKLKDEIWNMFLKNEIEWDSQDIKMLKNLIKEEFEYEYKQSPDDYCGDYDIEKEIDLAFEENKEKIFNEIQKSSIEQINHKTEYILIEEFRINHVG